jgi:hypothetical protein
VALLRVVVPLLVQMSLVLVQISLVLVQVTTVLVQMSLVLVQVTAVLVLAVSLVVQVAWGAMRRPLLAVVRPAAREYPGLRRYGGSVGSGPHARLSAWRRSAVAGTRGTEIESAWARASANKGP